MRAFAARYPWIKSVTIFEESGRVEAGADALQLCAEQGWTRLGVLDLPRLRMNLRAARSLERGSIRRQARADG